jgi:uncharacterized LabA/DUF88 family protein
MKKEEINKILKDLETTRDRNIVIVDYGNVQKWEKSLGWKIGIKELSNLIKHISFGKKYLRKFYYGSDFGQSDKSQIRTKWSAAILDKAEMNNFEIKTKRVKYIFDKDYKTGFVKKCNFDVEMSVDLIKEVDNYDRIILFSGDGDLAYVLDYLKEKHKKDSIVFGARNRVGKELYDAKFSGVVKEILHAEDFEYRLVMNRFRRL